MTSSALATRHLWTDKYNSRNGARITRIIPHHTAGVNTQANINALSGSKSGTKASAHYLILKTGEIIAIVPEEYRSWTAGSYAADQPSVEMEIENDVYGGNWHVSDAAFNSAIKLIADIAKRYGLGTVDVRSTMRKHKEFQATACPGPYLESRWQEIANLANAINGGGSAPVHPEIPASPQVAKIATDGSWGKDTTGKAQLVLGTPYDRVVSHQWSGNRVYLATANWNGSGWQWDRSQIGSSLIRRMMEIMKNDGQYHGAIDGLAGAQFAQALTLRFNGFSDNKLDTFSKAVSRMQDRLNNGKF